MNTRRLTYLGRVRIAAGAAVIGTALLASPALAGESSAATPAVSPAGSALSPQLNSVQPDQARLGTASSSTSLKPISLPTGFRPEGITSGAARAFYVGSLADGRILAGSFKTGTTRQLTAGVTGRSVRGMEWDKRSNLLWVAGQDGSQGIVLAVDVTTGAVKHRIEIPGAKFLNDVLVEPHGVWVTDSQVDRLLRLDLSPKTGAWTGRQDLVPLKGEWPATVAGKNGANGISNLWDGTILLNNSTAGGIYTVSPYTGQARNILVKRGPGITGGDGLERKGHTLFVVRGNSQNAVEALKLHHNSKGWRATWKKTLTSPQLDVPSTGAFVNHTLWTVNARFGVANPESASYQIVPLGKKTMRGIETLLK
ncbi:NHL repeat-containing protein [Kineosporia succinea]|uniref:Sugar lactone lactonase YvrE n=1 Tax=Kineosporia succinea TaxID=84632 RepID=A0ABT9NXC3_9ACTN|nr:hypothetical protein [Kineosporia succinea]MDP9824789.1 hypothetical protein [Kineosporia succinea]